MNHYGIVTRLKNHDFEETIEKLNEIRELIHGVIYHKEPFSIKDLVIDGNDIMNIMEIKPGPKIKEYLNYLLEKVLENPDINTRENLIELLNKFDNK